GAAARRWTQPPRPAGWVVNGHLVRTASGEVVAGGLRPASTVPHPPAGGWSRRPGGGPGSASGQVPPAAPLAPAAGSAGAAAGLAALAGGAPADQVLVESLRTAHEIIEAGHELVLNYLGVAPTRAAGSVAPLDLSAAAPQVATTPAVLPTAPAAGMAVASEVGAAPAPAGRSLPEPDVLLARLTGIVSARTG